LRVKEAEMQTAKANHYEAAFESWLTERRIPFAAIHQTRRLTAGEETLKSFDFLLWPGTAHPVPAEVKGRTFGGVSLAGLRGLDCWTTAEDVRGLRRWERLFRQTHAGGRAVFVFVFRLRQVDVDADGLDIFTWDGWRYVFFAAEARAYLACCRVRSPRWRTVTLGAEDFRRIAVPLEDFIETICAL